MKATCEPEPAGEVVDGGGSCVEVAELPGEVAGVKQVLEVYRQKKGQCGDFPMSKTPD